MRHKPTGWLSEKEAAQVTPADTAFESPIPTQIVSNGEYNPLPQTEKQKQVEGLIKEYADKYAKYHGMDRRSFLKTASGMAAAFLAMNKVFGPVWEVSEAEAADRDMADERAKKLLRLIHVRGDVVVNKEGERLLRAPNFLQDFLGGAACLARR